MNDLRRRVGAEVDSALESMTPAEAHRVMAWDSYGRFVRRHYRAVVFWLPYDRCGPDTHVYGITTDGDIVASWRMAHALLPWFAPAWPVAISTMSESECGPILFALALFRERKRNERWSEQGAVASRK